MQIHRPYPKVTESQGDLCSHEGLRSTDLAYSNPLSFCEISWRQKHSQRQRPVRRASGAELLIHSFIHAPVYLSFYPGIK